MCRMFACYQAPELGMFIISFDVEGCLKETSHDMTKPTK